MTTKEDFELIVAICERAEQLGITTYGDRFTMILDIENAHKQFTLRLSEMLNGPEYDFCHDFVGIQANMNRRTCKIETLFVPRYAS